MKNITHNDLILACLSFMARGEVAPDNAAIINRAKLVHDMIGEVDTSPNDIVGQYEINGIKKLIQRDGAEIDG